MSIQLPFGSSLIGGRVVSAAQRNFVEAGLRRGLGLDRIYTVMRETELALPRAAVREIGRELRAQATAAERLFLLPRNMRLREDEIPQTLRFMSSRYGVTLRFSGLNPETGQIEERIRTLRFTQNPTRGRIERELEFFSAVISDSERLRDVSGSLEAIYRME